MQERNAVLKVADIAYDTDNPRIKMALEKYGDDLNAERIFFALRSATEGQSGVSSYNSLKDSIRASGGVRVPITVIRENGKYVCIDGNTRLAIYRQLEKESAPGDWTQIKSVVMEDVQQRDIETIRVSAHLVGAREWPAYEKARYLHYLRERNFMGYEQLVSLCGGNKSTIEQHIDAYHDMNRYYRDVVDESAFRMDRFSGFVELQKRNVKNAILEAGLELKDFGEWIRDGKIYRADTVRDLPRVLRDGEARKTFLEGGKDSIEEATRLLDQRERDDAERNGASATLETATLSQLAKSLTKRINDIPYAELRMLKAGEVVEAVDQVVTLENSATSLRGLLQYVGSEVR